MSETIYSPLRVRLLLHCFVSSHLPIPNIEQPAQSEDVQDLVRLSAIARTTDAACYETTKLGRAWVEAICNVKVPRVAYLDEMGRELEAR